MSQQQSNALFSDEETTMSSTQSDERKASGDEFAADSSAALLRFENLILQAGLAKVTLEVVLLNARLQHQFNHDEFDDWCVGEIQDAQLWPPSRLELYQEVKDARDLFDDCRRAARGVVA